MIKKVSLLLTVILVTVLAACASTRPVPPLDLASQLPDVAAGYVTTRKHEHSEKYQYHEKTHPTEKGKTEPETSVVNWHLFRQQNRIDIDNITAHTGETWLRNGKTLVMRQLFHDDRKGVEYLMDDFAVLGMQPSWQQQALLFDPQVLQQLPEVGTEWVDGHPVRRYRGTVDGQQFDVQWLVDLNMPYAIVRTHADEQEVTQLQAVYPLAQSPWQYNNGEDYELIDYADLGDRERDPFVLKIQSQLPGGNVHHH